MRILLLSVAVLALMLTSAVCSIPQNAQAMTVPALSNSTITAVLSGFNPATGAIPTTQYAPPSGCPMPQPSSAPGAINKIQCGLYAFDSLTNETMTQQQLNSSRGYWFYGGDAPGEKAPYAFYRDMQGLHIGVQAPSNGTYAGYYAVTPSTNAMLFHAVLTSPLAVTPYGDFQNGLYVQTTQAPVNYVTCVAITNNQATVWAIVHTYGSPFGSLVFDTLWYDPSSNQPLTRDCTMITNGHNYLKVYLDGTMVYSSNALALGMPAPFNAFLEPQTSYNGQLLYGSYKDFYATTTENIQVQNNPSNAASAELVDSLGNVLASAPVLLSNVTMNVGKFDFPLIAGVKVVDSNNTQIASTPSATTVFGGDVYSVVSNSASSGGTSSGGTATVYSGRATGLSVQTPVLNATFADTGQLPPSGGEIEASALNMQTSQAHADGMISVTMGFDNVAQSQTTTSDVALLPGTQNQITADFIRADSSATCTGVAGNSEISNLKLGGQQVNVTGAVNQTVSIPGVLTLVINEHISSGSKITVNAIDLRAASGDRVLISSASSGITCATATASTKDFVTGGGYILASGQHANFGFVAGYKPNKNTPSGQLNYVDHSMGMHVKSVDVTSYSGSGSTRTFSGDATINGASGYTYTVTATDNGDPGKGNDYFAIKLSNGYSASGLLAGGNIKLHK